jgi:glycosyltransferase 2 family protein
VTEPVGDRIVRILRPVLTLAALVAVAVALVDAVREAGEIPVPPVTWTLWSTLLAAGAVVIAAVAWMVLLDGPTLRRVLPGFVVAQLAKYVPGSIWQGVSQVLDADRLGVGRARASLAFALQLWTQLLAAGLVAGLALLGDGARWPWLVLIASLVAAASLWRPLLARIATLLARPAGGRFPRLQGLPGGLPAQRVLGSAATLGVATIVLGGAGYAALLVGPSPSMGTLAIVGAYATAWVLGFLVVPLPAGVGVREFVLLALLGGTYGAAAVLAAAVAYRVVTLVAEVLLAVGASAAGRDRGERRRGDRQPGRGTG